MKRFFLVLLLVTFVFGCSKSPQTVEFYKTHDVERKAILDKWASNPSKFANDKDCINALAADAELASRGFYKNMAKPGKRTVDPSVTIK